MCEFISFFHNPKTGEIAFHDLTKYYYENKLAKGDK
jgi:hypothetical protein